MELSERYGTFWNFCVTRRCGEAAAALVPKLGTTLARRRMIEAVAAVLLVAMEGRAGWYLHGLPLPWEFRGEITNRQTCMPITGVEVVVETGAGEKHSVYTDAQGTYFLRLPQPQPKTIHVLFRKEGYEAEPRFTYRPANHSTQTCLSCLSPAMNARLRNTQVLPSLF